MNTASVARRSRSHPVLAGAFVGLVAGLVGLLAPALGAPLLGGVSVFGGMLGAVAGGATAAYLADDGLRTDVLYACLADVLSSVLFFVLVLVGYLAFVAHEEGLALVSAVGASFFYVVFGSLVAIPVGIVSLCVAAASGAAMSMATDGESGGQDVAGADRK